MKMTNQLPPLPIRRNKKNDKAIEISLLVFAAALGLVFYFL